MKLISFIKMKWDQFLIRQIDNNENVRFYWTKDVDNLKRQIDDLNDKIFDLTFQITILEEYYKNNK